MSLQCTEFHLKMASQNILQQNVFFSKELQVSVFYFVWKLFWELLRVERETEPIKSLCVHATLIKGAALKRNSAERH